MVPQLAPLQPGPDSEYVTAGFAVPPTVGVNCWLEFTVSVGAVGEMLIVTGVIETVAWPDWVGSACEVAVTMIDAGLGAVVGAVYNPLEEIDPHVAPVQP
jgi:hypothetical protein